jgi:hypothetical protein
LGGWVAPNENLSTYNRAHEDRSWKGPRKSFPCPQGELINKRERERERERKRKRKRKRKRDTIKRENPGL